MSSAASDANGHQSNGHNHSTNGNNSVEGKVAADPAPAPTASPTTTGETSGVTIHHDPTDTSPSIPEKTPSMVPPTPLAAAVPEKVVPIPPNPIVNAGWYSFWTFQWLFPLLRIGAKEPLKMDHIYDLREEDRTTSILKVFKPMWDEEVKTSLALKRKPKLKRPLAKFLWKPFVISGFLFGLSCASQVGSPVLMTNLLTFMQKKDLKIRYPSLNPSLFPSDMNEGYWWALGLFGVAFGGALTRSVSMFISNDVLLRMRSAVTALLFQKALRVPSHTRKEGDVMSIMTTDTMRMLELAIGVHMLWTSPIIIIIGVWLLYNQVGPASLAGFAALFLSFPFAGKVVVKQVIAQRAAAKQTDKRVNFINEFIQGIRVVKYYAWEKPFIAVVDKAREEELYHMRHFLIAKALSIVIMVLMPLLSAVVTFIVFVADGGDMTPSTVFTTLSLLYVIRFPFTFLPLSINAWVQLGVALGRIENFLMMEEVDSTRLNLTQTGVEVNEAEFRWTSDVTKEKFPRLAKISFTAGPGELVSIVGPVASGKSTLLHGILGELTRSKGTVGIGGRIAYVPQSAFIINNTLRENILFGKPFDAVKYSAVIKACALQADLDQLDRGDMTEIGERGINISGGQKQRVSLARACYDDDAQIVLLDDPLSAVDAHVARHLFDECINGFLKNKCRIFVTHTLQFLPRSDKICYLQETENKDSYTIGLQGTYEQLMQTPAFSSLIETFNKGKEDMKKDETGAEGAGEKKKVEKKKDKAGPAAKLVEAEEREEGTVDLDVVKHYYGAGGSWPFFLLTFFFFCTTLVSILLGDFWLSYWTDNVQKYAFNGGSDPHGVAYYLGIYGAFSIGSNFFLLGRSFSVIHFAITASRKIHRHLFRNMLAKSSTWYDRTPTGRILNRFTKDMYVLDQSMGPLTESASSTWLLVTGTLIVVAIVVPPALAVIFLLAIVYYVVQAYYRKSSRELQRLDSLTRTPIITHFGEALAGCVSIRALAAVEQYERGNIKRIDENQRCWTLTQAASYWIRFRLDSMGAVLILAASVLAVASHDIGISIDASKVGLMMTYSFNLTNVLNWAILLATQLETSFNSIERLRYYSIESDHEQWQPKDDKATALIQNGWPSAGKVEFRNYTMRYRPDLPIVLNKVNVTFPAGARVGIVGRTGSGKSTMLISLFRMVEATEGGIFIDDVEIGNLGLTDLRSRLSIIPQDPVLFAGTLRYNLDPFEQFDDTAVWQALEYVQLKDVIQRMTNKLSTVTTEAGKDLSLGQRQLMCLARAMLRKPRIICLDEATANVDVQTDAVIQSIIREKFNHSTVITIAHRLNTIMDYDYVLVMDKGQVAEFDNPMVLKNRAGSVFADMVAQHASGEGH